MTLRTVAVVVVEPFGVFEYGIVEDVFGIDRTAVGVPAFEFRVCTPTPGPVRTTGGGGVRMQVDRGLEALEGADLVVLASTDARSAPPALVDAVGSAFAAGATVLTVCSGVFLLAATGLLDGRTATCHWHHARGLARLFPAVTVDADSLYVDEGRIITSAGKAAGIDACLHLVRREFGGEVANTIARRMVLAPVRDGGQRQFVGAPVPERVGEGLGPVLDWVLDHLEMDHSIASLARRAALSERTFARRFSAEVGTTPHRWLVGQRVAAARRLLEASDLPVESVATRVGFGSASVLRQHLQREVGLSPVEYRRRFAM